MPRIPRILIVDDEAVVRMSLHEYLEDCEFDVSSADCAEEALALMAGGQMFDIVIADLRMPRMNGEEFILKAAALYSSTKFIIQTGTIGYVVSEELMKVGVGAESVLKKPVMRLDSFEQLIIKLLHIG